MSACDTKGLVVPSVITQRRDEIVQLHKQVDELRTAATQVTASKLGNNEIKLDPQLMTNEETYNNPLTKSGYTEHGRTPLRTQSLPNIMFSPYSLSKISVAKPDPVSETRESSSKLRLKHMLQDVEPVLANHVAKSPPQVATPENIASSIPPEEDGMPEISEADQEVVNKEQDIGETNDDNNDGYTSSPLKTADISDAPAPILLSNLPGSMISLVGNQSQSVQDSNISADSAPISRSYNYTPSSTATNPFMNLDLLQSIKSETPTPPILAEEMIKSSPFFGGNCEPRSDSDTVDTDKEKRFESVVIRKFSSLKNGTSRLLSDTQSENDTGFNTPRVPANSHGEAKATLFPISENQSGKTLSSQESNDNVQPASYVSHELGNAPDKVFLDSGNDIENIIIPMKPLASTVTGNSGPHSSEGFQANVSNESSTTEFHSEVIAPRNSQTNHSNTMEWDDVPLDSTMNESGISYNIHGRLSSFNLTNIPLKVEEEAIFLPNRAFTTPSITISQDSTSTTEVPEGNVPEGLFDSRVVLRKGISSLGSNSKGVNEVADAGNSNEMEQGLPKIDTQPKKKNPFRTGTQVLENMYLEEYSKIRTEIFYSPSGRLDPNIRQQSLNSAGEVVSKSDSSGSRNTSGSSNPCSLETIPTPLFPSEAKARPVYIDDPFGFEQLDPLGRSGPKELEDYLSVWSTQDSILPTEEKRSESIRSTTPPERQLAVQKQLLESKRNFSFRPTSISRSKYHYHPNTQPDSLAKVDKVGVVSNEGMKEVKGVTLGDAIEDDSISLSLSEEMDRIFGAFGTDSASVESELYESPGPVKIWSKEAADLTKPDEVEQHDLGSKVSFEEALADDIKNGKLKISGVYPSSVKNFTCNVRSCEASIADEELVVNEKAAETEPPTTTSPPPKQPDSPFLREHIRSPFKVRSSKYGKSPRVPELIKFDEVLKAKLRASSELTKPVIIEGQPIIGKKQTEIKDPKVSIESNAKQSLINGKADPQPSQMPSAESNEPKDNYISEAISLVALQDQYNQGSPPTSEERQSALVDYGVVYVFVEKIKINIEGIHRHRASFSLEVNNGINVTQTEWSKVNKSNYLIVGKEFELPITSFDQKLTFVLRCRYTRPENELVEVVEKVNMGRSLGGLGKTKYAYEKKFVQKPVEFDEWDYAFAPDGSAGYLELLLQKDFLRRIKFRREHVSQYEMVNKWARIYDKRKDPKLRHELPHRQPYSVGKIKLWACFIERTSNSERFPKTMALVNDIIKKYKKQAKITKEGFLMQEGGDAQNGMIKRYFKLEGTQLVGYHEVSRNPKIKINLLKVKNLEERGIGRKSGGRYFTDSLLDSSFKLIFEDGECITMNSEISRADAREWCEKIRESLDLNFVHQPWVKKFVRALEE